MKEDKQIQKLLDDFSKASRIHHEALLVGDSRTANRQAKKIHGSFLKIVSLGADARTALLALGDADFLPVAAMAAVYSLKYSPERALSVLLNISKQPGLIGFEAEQAIQRWNEGSWQLE